MGEMYVRGPTSAIMYWNNREKSRSTFQGEWTRSGDKYIEDEDGYYVCCGRADDMLKVSRHVRLAVRGRGRAVLASGGAGGGGGRLVRRREAGQAEGLRRAQVPDKASEELADALQEHVKQLLAPYKYPRWIEFRAELPKTATGKIQRFKLRAEGQL